MLAGHTHQLTHTTMLRTVSSKAIRAIPSRVQAPCVSLATARKAYSSMPQHEEGAEAVRPEVCMWGGQAMSQCQSVRTSGGFFSCGFQALKLHPAYRCTFLHFFSFLSLFSIHPNGNDHCEIIISRFSIAEPLVAHHAGHWHTTNFQRR